MAFLVLATVATPAIADVGETRPARWPGFKRSFHVTKRDVQPHGATPQLAAGRYTFEMSGGRQVADLYVRVGDKPSKEGFTCRPFVDGADERCEITLARPAVIYWIIMTGLPTIDVVLEAKQL